MADPAIIDDNNPIDPPAGDPPVTPPADPAGDPPSVNADPPVADPVDPVDPPADDWRTRMAGEDKDLLGFLGRYQSEKAFVQAAKKDRDSARSKTVTKLPDKPTAEELSAYRKDNGIPEEPAKYLDTLPDGLVVGDDDRPFVDKFLESMHGTNAPPGMVNAALATYYDIVEEQQAAELQLSREAQSAGVEALREEWGADYKRNLNIMHAHLDSLPPAVGDAFRFGKGADGVPLGYNPEVLQWLTGLALEQNPVATVVPGAGANQAHAIADEISGIEKTMATNRTAYNKDERMQARYRELINARLKLEGKS